MTRDDGAEIETLMRARTGPAWQATADFVETVGYQRRAMQIPGAAHCALEYQRWAVRSQLRPEGRRFMRAMDQPLGVPSLHLRGAQDPYVLADAVAESRRWARDGRFVTLAAAGHFTHEESPDEVNDLLAEFLTRSR